MSYKILFDGNDSGFIRVVGIGDYMPLSQHQLMASECEHKSKLLEEALVQNAELVAHNQALIDRVEKLNQKNFELTCFSVDVLRCLKTIAFEHNWSDVARYQQLAKDCMESIQNNDQLRQIQADAVDKLGEYLTEKGWDRYEFIISEYADKIRQGESV